MSEFLIPLLKLTAICSIVSLINGRPQNIPFILGGALILSAAVYILCRINHSKNTEQSISSESEKRPEPTYQPAEKRPEPAPNPKSAIAAAELSSRPSKPGNLFVNPDEAVAAEMFLRKKTAPEENTIQNETIISETNVSETVPKENITLEKVCSFETFCEMTKYQKHDIRELDFSHVDFSHIPTIQDMFKDCLQMRKLILPDSILDLQISISLPTGKVHREKVRRTQEEINYIYKWIYINEGPGPMNHTNIDPYTYIDIPEMELKHVQFGTLTKSEQLHYLGIVYPEKVSFSVSSSNSKNDE